MDGGLSSPGFPRFYAAALAVGGIVVLALSALHLDHERRKVLERWESRLTATTEALEESVGSWVGDRRADAEVLAANPLIAVALSPAARSSPQELVPLLDRVAAAYGYNEIHVFGAAGIVVAHAGGAASPGQRVSDLAREVMRSGRARIDLSGEGEAANVFTVVAPVRSASGAAGAVALTMAPAKELFRLLSVASARFLSGRIFLVWRETAGPASLSVPALSPGQQRHLPDALAQTALRGQVTVGPFADGRGTAVLGATRAIRDTGWGLVRLIDQDEALAGFHAFARMEVLVVVLALLAFAVVVANLWQSQRTQLLEAGVRHQRNLLAANERLRLVLAQVPAILWTTDRELRFTSTTGAGLGSLQRGENQFLGSKLGIGWQATRMGPR